MDFKQLLFQMEDIIKISMLAVSTRNNIQYGITLFNKNRHNRLSYL